MLLAEQKKELAAFRRILNPYDEGALEAALRLKDQAAFPVHLSAVNAACSSSTFADDLYAIGFDRVFQVKSPSLTPFSPLKAAELVAGICQDLSPISCVFTGLTSEPGENGLFPYALAKELAMPCIPYVCEAEWDAHNALSCSVHFDHELWLFSLNGPALLAFENAAHPYLRIPTLRDRLASQGKETIHCPAKDFKETAPLITFESYQYTCSARECLTTDIQSLSKQLLPE